MAEGTDKTFLVNDYLRHYSRILEPFRHADITVLEIGVAEGGSTRTWEQYFTRARIIGIDIKPHCRRHASERVVVEIGSQTDVGFLRDVAARYQPTIIIGRPRRGNANQSKTITAVWNRPGRRPGAAAGMASRRTIVV